MGLASITNNILTDTGITPSGVISGTLASGQVAYGSAANTIAGSNNLYWDASNGRLGIGTNAPAQALDANGNARISGSLTVNQEISLGSGQVLRWGSALGIVKGNQLVLYSGTSAGVAGGTVINYWNGSAFASGLQLTNNANTILQAGGTFTDNGQRLQVYGDTLLRGSGNDSTTTALTVQNSDSTNLLRIRNDSTAIFGGGAQFSSFISNSTASSPLQIRANVASLTSLQVNFTSSITAGSGSYNVLEINQNFSPTSGTATFNNLLINNTINQTGGANGITRGLYVNPILTAAADWRSIEWSNNSGWGLYGAGTAPNYLAGRLGVGSTSLANTTVRVGNNITGATSHFSVFASQTVLSDVANASIFTTEISTQATAFTLNTLRHYRATQGTFGASSIVTNQYGFFAESTLTDATNNYGFWGDIAAATGRWNIYMAGTANNYMAGALGIGSTSLTGVSLLITRDITGGVTSYGARISSLIQSDVTSTALGVTVELGTAAAAFTVAGLNYYTASQLTIGAGSSISEQNGFHVYPTLIGAGLNVGFRGRIPSGTGRWNMYFDGTAANYLAGSTGIGTTSMTYKFNVTDSTATYVAGFRGSANTYIVIGDTSLAGEQGVNIRNSSGQGFFGLDGTIFAMSATSGANALSFGVGGTQGMRLTVNRNLLLQNGGTFTDSGERLQVDGTMKVTGASTFSSTVSAVGTLNLQRSGSGADTTIQYKNEVGANRAKIVFGGTNEELGFYAGGGTVEHLKIANNGIATFSNKIITAAGLDAIEIGTPAGNNYRSNIYLKGTDGSAGAVNAYFGVNVFSTTGILDISNTNGISVRTGGSERLGIASTGAATFSSSVTATSFFESSDIRLKDVIIKKPSIGSFGAIQYKWKDGRDDKMHWGYSAQDVMNWIPDSVNVNNDGHYILDYNQAHTYKIATLEDRIALLEQELNELKNK